MTALCRSVLQLLLLLLTGTGTAVLLGNALNSGGNSFSQKDQNAWSSVSNSTVDDQASRNEGHNGQLNVEEIPADSPSTSPSGPAPGPDGNVLDPDDASTTGAGPAAAARPSFSPHSHVTHPTSGYSATSSSSSAVACPTAAAAATSNHGGTDSHERATARAGTKTGFGRHLWRRVQKYTFDKHANEGTYEGVVARAPNSHCSTVSRIKTRPISDPHPCQLGFPSGTGSVRSSEKKKLMSLCIFRPSLPPQTWSLKGNLADPPPFPPPTVYEFAAALHTDLPERFQRAIAAARAVSSSSQSSSGTSASVRRQRFRLFGSKRHSLNPGEMLQWVADSSTGGSARSNSFEERLKRRSFSWEAGRPRSGSGASRPHSAHFGGSLESDDSRDDRSRGTRSPQSSFDSDKASSDFDEPVSRTTESFATTVRLPFMTLDEQRLVNRLIVTFVIERLQPRHPPVPAIPLAVREAAVRRMTNPDRMQYFLSATELGMMGDETFVSEVPLIETTAYVLPVQVTSQQSTHMRRELVKLRGALWALSKLNGGTLLPWQAAARYNLHVPIDVAVVEGIGSLFPESHGHVIVNAFVTREVLLCTLDELLRLRPTDPSEERGVWHLLLLSLSLQVIQVLGQLSEAGISVSEVDGSNLALAVSGALVVTSIEPKASVPAEDANTVSRLLFRIWSRHISVSCGIHTDAARANPDDICNPRLPSIVAYAVKSLSARESHQRMTLKALRSSRMFEDLAVSLPVVASRVHRETQLSKYTLVEAEEFCSRL